MNTSGNKIINPWLCTSGQCRGHQHHGRRLVHLRGQGRRGHGHFQREIRTHRSRSCSAEKVKFVIWSQWCQRPISWDKNSEENSNWQNLSELNLILFPIVLGWEYVSSQVESNHTLNFVSCNWPQVKSPFWFCVDISIKNLTQLKPIPCLLRWFEHELRGWHVCV